MLLSKIKVVGHSMEPSFYSGDFVLASSIPYLFGKPKVGDIIVFKKTNKIFTKRIAKIDREKYFVKGDNNKDSLEIGWIPKNEILGKVMFKNF